MLMVAGCGTFEPSEEWIEFTPPLIFRVWHGEVENCLGIQQPFDDIVWRRVGTFTFQCNDPRPAFACIVFPNTIYLLHYILGDERIVKGELVHYVRQKGDHDESFIRCSVIS